MITIRLLLISFNLEVLSKYNSENAQSTVNVYFIKLLQKPLPKLPVPELRTTLTRYLGVVAPLVDDETFKRTRSLVHEFIRSGGEGDELQAELKAYAKTQINWVICALHIFYCFFFFSPIGTAHLR